MKLFFGRWPGRTFAVTRTCKSATRSDWPNLGQCATAPPRVPSSRTTDSAPPSPSLTNWATCKYANFVSGNQSEQQEKKCRPLARIRMWDLGGGLLTANGGHLWSAPVGPSISRLLFHHNHFLIRNMIYQKELAPFNLIVPVDMPLLSCAEIYSEFTVSDCFITVFIFRKSSRV